MGQFAIAIHGGAGAVHPDHYQPGEIRGYELGLKASLDRAYAVLEQGGSAVDAVTEAVLSLEDCPLFNAGHGSVLTADEKVQMDASIMSGKDESCGGVTLLERVRNPILAARIVRERSPHRLLGAAEAEALAAKHGLEFCPPEYFIVPKRFEQLRKAKEKDKIELDHSTGTVGAVALDAQGNLAAATSTGGLTNRLSGRVSDSSIIGAGTYANNQTLAISGTGTGDYFIQNVLCFDAHALMLYAGRSLEQACEDVLTKLKRAGGHGGVIAMNARGEVVLPFNSAGMFRGYRKSGGDELIACFA